jgi:hypothetical protein
MAMQRVTNHVWYFCRRYSGGSKSEFERHEILNLYIKLYVCLFVVHVIYFLYLSDYSISF